MDADVQYASRFENHLKIISPKLEVFLRGIFSSYKRIDRISARAKDPASFSRKALKVVDGHKKYSDPLSEIQDQIGARITVFFQTDVQSVSTQVLKYLRKIEQKQVVPESQSEFGYFGEHLILKLPADMVSDGDKGQVPDFFELQIKTLFQHAWSEANHDLGYKSDQILSAFQRRKLAFTSAQAWGADMIFAELFQETDRKD